ncbi:SusC/RagA family TonB-linked outer membrane protein [Sphingobacterium sp. PU5-4]|uniref:SusC/RagA family TonB-linked outer membrane protein n=1 Tax=Sphingobacterium tenebrionis TaxID=3111775 RepID=A0ABU8I1Y1_9SPHI
MKTKDIIVFLFLIFLGMCQNANSQQLLRGVVLDASSHVPIPQAVVLHNGKRTMTDSVGAFHLRVRTGDRIRVTDIAHHPKEHVFSDADGTDLTILLEPLVEQLEEVVVSSGYQELSKKDVTGSVAVVSRAELDKNPDPNILSRLRDAVPGLIFNKLDVLQRQSISIGGKSTLFANSEPLVILDNFPYEGDISDINPQDVQSITVLKDAAAAAIWGARAGNGVIVIKSKKGIIGQSNKFNASMNLGISDPVDLFYNARMTSPEFIDMEKRLFENGYYRSQESSQSNTPLSPAVELMIAHREGLISADQLDLSLMELGAHDVRKDLMKEVYRPEMRQQYAVSHSFSGRGNAGMVSLGYDRNRENLQGNSNDRLNLTFNQQIKVWKDRITITPGIGFTQRAGDRPNRIPVDLRFGSTSIYPYAVLRSPEGDPLAVTRSYRRKFLESALQQGLLDWEYVPLSDVEHLQFRTNDRMLRASLNADLELLSGLKLSADYRWLGSWSSGKSLYGPQSYYARDMVNNYTFLNGGQLQYGIPQGGILDGRYGNGSSHNLRTQLQYDKDWEDHRFNILVGGEVSDANSRTDSYRLYGYDPEHHVSGPVNYLVNYKQYSSPFSRRIPYQDSGSDLTDRFLSYYSTLGYYLKDRYLFNASARLDRSNIFGVRSNQKGIPLFSLSAAWSLDREDFFRPLSHLFSGMKLRLSYGHTGNVDNSLSSLMVAQRSPVTADHTGLPYSTIMNPANPELRWERVAISNIGIDMVLLGGKLDVTLDSYRKIGRDLLGSIDFPTSSGIFSFYGNTAGTKTWGTDISLKGRFPISAKASSTTSFMFSYNRDEVTHYTLEHPVTSVLSAGQIGSFPVVGRPIHSIFAYHWSGLDSDNGRPLGMINGEVSGDHRKIIQSSKLEDLLFVGTSRPRMFGSLRQEFIYSNMSLAIGLSYRLGYWYRRESVNYNHLFTATRAHGDFSERWKVPGDELYTQVPSMPTVRDNNEVLFYTNSAILVEPGDHIRIQDIRAQYRFQTREIPGTVALFGHIENVGMLWKSSGKKLDPDHPNQKALRYWTFGMRIDF